MSGKKPIILITGATGFVGTRLAERLVLSEYAHVKALVHKLSSPGLPRLARLPVEMIQGNVLDLPSVKKAVEGCDVIVHLAYGGKKVTVKGTENVLKAAMHSEVSKIIYFSTSVVHGRNPKVKLVDESSPFRNDGDVYCSSKIEAEKIVWRYHQKYGLPIVVFRPTCIYGPYGRMWTIRPIKEIKEGAITLVDGGEGAANVVYIDNVIDAIFLAIENDRAVGEAFIITDDEQLTWADFYQCYSDMFLNHPPLREASLQEIGTLRRMKSLDILKETVTFPIEFCRILVRSPEVRKQIKGLTLARLLGGKLPDRLKKGLKDWMKKETQLNPRTIEGMRANLALIQIPSEDLIKLYISHTRFSNSKLKQLLGWRQRIGFEEAMELTKKWLEYQRLIK